MCTKTRAWAALVGEELSRDGCAISKKNPSGNMSERDRKTARGFVFKLSILQIFNFQNISTSQFFV